LRQADRGGEGVDAGPSDLGQLAQDQQAARIGERLHHRRDLVGLGRKLS